MLHGADLIPLPIVVFPRFVSIFVTLQTSITFHQHSSLLSDQVFGFLHLLESVLGLLTIHAR